MSDALLMREFGDWLVSGIQYVISEVVSGLTHPAFLGFMCIGVFPSLLMFWLFCEGEEKLGIESDLFLCRLFLSERPFYHLRLLV